MSEFVSADIGQMERFISESANAITEFEAIKTKFGDINTALLGKWQGEGSDAYRFETDHILEKIGSIKDVLDGISASITDIKDSYNNLDAELGEFNRNPQASE